MESESVMENTENTVNKSSNKAAETLAKELEGLSNEELHEFFMFFYKMNHMNGYNVFNFVDNSTGCKCHCGECECDDQG